MARKEYFSPEEKLLFNNPPELNHSQRLIFLEISKWAEDYAASLFNATTRAGFLLQLGYSWMVTRLNPFRVAQVAVYVRFSNCTLTWGFTCFANTFTLLSLWWFFY